MQGLQGPNGRGAGGRREGSSLPGLTRQGGKHTVTLQRPKEDMIAGPVTVRPGRHGHGCAQACQTVRAGPLAALAGLGVTV